MMASISLVLDLVNTGQETQIAQQTKLQHQLYFFQNVFQYLRIVFLVDQKVFLNQVILLIVDG